MFFLWLTRGKGVWRSGGGLSLAHSEDVFFLVKDAFFLVKVPSGKGNPYIWLPLGPEIKEAGDPAEINSGSIWGRFFSG